MNNRPMGVTLISGFYMITGLLGAAWSLLVSVFGVVLVCFVPGVLAGGIWRLVTSVLSVILGASLWSGADWSPLVVSVLAVLGIIGNALDAIGGGGWLWNGLMIAINVIVLLYMQSDQVKRFIRAN